MSADAKLKAYIDRILRCREAEDLAKDDTKAVYAELAGDGYEKSVVGQVVTFLRKREKDGDKLSEQSAKFDLYLEAYERPSHAHTRVRAAEATTNTELLGGFPVAAAEFNAEETGVLASTRQGMSVERGMDQCVTDRRDDHLIHQSDDDAFAEVKGRARLANADGVEPSSSVHPSDQPSKDQSNEVAISSALRAGLADPTSNTGEGAASALPAKSGVTMEDVPPMPMKRPAFAHCFPELSNAAYERLGTDIAFKGIHDPIIRWGDMIVDGWARYNIARELGISYPVQEYNGHDVLLDVIEWQRAARNFTPAQERKIAADLAKELPHRADDIMSAFGLAEALEAAE